MYMLNIIVKSLNKDLWVILYKNMMLIKMTPQFEVNWLGLGRISLKTVPITIISISFASKRCETGNDIRILA